MGRKRKFPAPLVPTSDIRKYFSPVAAPQASEPYTTHTHRDMTRSLTKEDEVYVDLTGPDPDSVTPVAIPVTVDDDEGQQRKEKCMYCGVEFNECVSLGFHQFEVHGYSDFQCKWCPFSAYYWQGPNDEANYEILQQASQHIIDPVPFEADDLKPFGVETEDTMDDRQHQFFCYICGESFAKCWSLNQHQYEIHDRKVFDCVHCNTAAELMDEKKNLFNDLEFYWEYVHDDADPAAKATIDEATPPSIQPEIPSITNNSTDNSDPPKKKNRTTRLNGDAEDIAINLNNVKQTAEKPVAKVVSDDHRVKCTHPGCPKTFTRRSYVVQHVRAVHEKRKDFECDICHAKFTQSSYILRHKRAVHDKRKDFECDICHAKFTQNSYLVQHVRTVHENRKDFECEECNSKFSTSSGLSRHVQDVHEKEKTFQCEICNKKFARKDTLNDHIRGVHHKEKNFVCEFCGNRFSKKSTLTTHINIHTGERPYECLECGSAFKQSQSLNQHKHIHDHDRKLFECPECPKKYTYAVRLRQHLYKHNTNAERPYSCDDCGCSFVRKDYLTRHLFIHSGEKPHQCQYPDCTSGFLYKAELKSHENIHSDVRPFQCPHPPCDFSTKWKQYLQKHVLVLHSNDDRRFQCSKCGRSCNSQEHLQRHEAFHDIVRKISDKGHNGRILHYLSNQVKSGTKPCGDKKCITCGYIITRDQIITEENDKEMIIQIPTRYSCKTANVIYAIGCEKCPKVKYIGQTSRTLAQRFREHLHSLVDGENRLLYRHFNDTLNDHSHEDMFVEIIMESSANRQQRLRDESLCIRLFDSYNSKHGLNMIVGKISASDN